MSGQSPASAYGLKDAMKEYLPVRFQRYYKKREITVQAIDEGSDTDVPLMEEGSAGGVNEIFIPKLQDFKDKFYST